MKEKGMCLLSLIFLLFLGSTSMAAQPDIGILWVKHPSGQPLTTIQYDPSSRLDLPIKIAVEVKGNYCPGSIGISGIRVGGRAHPHPPIPIPRPGPDGISYIDTILTIPSGLQPGRYTFEVVRVDRCPDTNATNDRKVVEIELISPVYQKIDYRIDSVRLCDGRSPSEGVLYSPDFPSDVCLKVKVLWNKVSPPYGILCSNKIEVSHPTGSSRIIHVIQRVNDPDPQGVSETTIRFLLPKGLNPGNDYWIDLHLNPSDPACDSNRGNNRKSLPIRLARMSGDDLMVKLSVKEKYVRSYLGIFDEDKWVAELEIANISGNENLSNVEVLFTYPTKSGYKTKNIIIDILPPKQWVHKTIEWDMEGVRIVGEVCAEVNPSKKIKELTYDNNKVCSKTVKD